MAEWSKAPDSSSGSRERAWVQIPLLTNIYIISLLFIQFCQFFCDTSLVSPHKSNCSPGKETHGIGNVALALGAPPPHCPCSSSSPFSPYPTDPIPHHLHPPRCRPHPHPYRRRYQVNLENAKPESSPLSNSEYSDVNVPAPLLLSYAGSIL
jgi:hypothetical protein